MAGVGLEGEDQMNPFQPGHGEGWMHAPVWREAGEPISRLGPTTEEGVTAVIVFFKRVDARGAPL